MGISAYKIWAVGPKVGLGATQPLHVGVAGIAKSNAAGPPTTVANELVCNRLASALLLPVPPGFLIQHNGAPHFVSLNFNLAGHSLPPASGASVVPSHPQLAWGIVLFDIWILNNDRHARNIAHDKTTNAVQIFDHSHALFARGQVQMTANADTPGIENHCLAPYLKGFEGFAEWCARIASLPDFFVKTAIEDVADGQFGVTLGEASFCADWLLDRRDRLKQIVGANRGVFPGIPATSWDAPGAPFAPPAPPLQAAAPTEMGGVGGEQ